MNKEANINFDLYSITEDGNVFSKMKNKFLSNNNAHPYIMNEFKTKDGGSDVFLRHRVVWFYFNGNIPLNMQIDHINGNKTDNRLENLRVLTPYDNTHNEITYKNFLNAVQNDVFREKISKANKGKKMSKNRYDKCSPTMFKIGHTVEQSVRDKISDANSKPVLQIDKNGKIIAEWKSASEAGKNLSINPSSISRCCVGGAFDKRRGKWVNCTQYKGYKWMYKSDYEKMLTEQAC